jgi:hypothetical protein
MIRSCFDLVAIAIDGRIDSDVQDQLRDLPRNQKMTHVGMLGQCHQHKDHSDHSLKYLENDTEQ